MMKPAVERDHLIRVSTLSATANPHFLCWLAAHQDYSDEPVDGIEMKYPDWEYGRRLIDHCVKFGHWGVIEHGSISLNACYFPHSVIQQARTHRVGISFDVQSFRYTERSIILGLQSDEYLEKAVYFRPVGHYTDRKGHKYDYTLEQREEDKAYAREAIRLYAKKRMEGWSEEHARGLMLFDYRQHFVVTFNPRSLLHFCDLRHKADAQLEIQWLAQGIFQEFTKWMPAVAHHYASTRLGKARLSP